MPNFYLPPNTSFILLFKRIKEVFGHQRFVKAFLNDSFEKKTLCSGARLIRHQKLCFYGWDLTGAKLCLTDTFSGAFLVGGGPYPNFSKAFVSPITGHNKMKASHPKNSVRLRKNGRVKMAGRVKGLGPLPHNKTLTFLLRSMPHNKDRRFFNTSYL